MLRVSNRSGAVIMLCGLLMCGCTQPESDLPETFPVTGEVRGQNGTPLRQGVIQFHTETGQALNASGTVTDGKFTLVTAFANGVRSGAIPGRYRVSVTPAFEIIPQSIELKDVYEIAPQPNEFTIDLASASKGPKK